MLVAAEGPTRRQVTIKDVLVGEVWFTAGQSNMTLNEVSHTFHELSE